MLSGEAWIGCVESREDGLDVLHILHICQKHWKRLTFGLVFLTTGQPQISSLGAVCPQVILSEW